MGKAEDLCGRQFADGMITVLARVESDKNRNSKWLCLCSCGNKFEEYALNLKAGRRSSCGRCDRVGLYESQMKQPSVSLSRLRNGMSDPWQDLANAIVAVAVDDYRMALQYNNTGLLESLEKFFYSDWYKQLTNLNPHNLLSLLRKEHNGTLGAVYI